MKITLKAVKYAAFASQETSCFEATVLVDGVALCHAENDGHGGMDIYTPVKGKARDDIRHVDEALKASAVRPENLEDWETKMWDEGYRPGLEDAVGEALEIYLRHRDFKRVLGRKMFGVHNGKTLQFKGKYSPELAQKAFEKYPGMVILNALPFDKAFEAAAATGAA